MALLGRLVVPVIADTTLFSSGLASSARKADAWSRRVGASADGAAAGLADAGKQATGLVGALDRVSKATRFSRNVVDIGELGRAAAWSAVGVGRLRLAFMRSGERADALRSRLDAAGEALRTVGRASERVRWGLLGADMGVLIARLGVLGGGAVGRAASALGSLAMAGVRVGAGLSRAAFATAGFLNDSQDALRYTGSLALNLGKAGAAFGGYALSLGRWSAAGAAGMKSLGLASLSLLGAVQEGRQALGWVPAIAGGLSGVLRGAVGATAGVARLGVALAGIGWSVSTGLARGFAAALGGVTRATLSVAAGMVKLGALGGAAGLVFGVKAAASAARLTEVVNKTKEVFGEYAKSVLDAADASSLAYGTKQREFLDSSSAIGGLLQGVGYAEEDAARLSVSLARLAKDMENFREIPFEEALRKIRAGLSGETEPLKSLGVLVDEQTVKTYAWTHGIAENGAALTNAQKVQARLAIITQGLAKDQGALARESMGTSAQINEFTGRLQTFFDTIGATLAPVLGAALQEVNTLLAVMTEGWRDSGSSILEWFGVTAEATGGAAEGMGILQSAIGWVADTWSLVKGAAYGAFSYIEAGISKLAAGFAAVLRAMEAMGAGDWATSAREFLEDYSESAKLAADGLWESSQAAFDGRGIKSDKINEYFDRVRDKIAKAREDLAKPLDFSAAAPKGLEAPENQGAKDRNPFAGAYELGSKGAAEIIARHTFGGTNDPAKHAKATADNTAKLLATARDLNKAILGAPRVAIMGLS